MTNLLEQREVMILRGAGLGTVFSQDSRPLLLARVDRAYASTLPRANNDADQLESDLTNLRELPYLVSADGTVHLPLVEYLEAFEARLGQRVEAEEIATIRNAVAERARGTVDAIDELLSSLADEAPTDVLERMMVGEGVQLQGITRRSAWALALHIAVRDDRLDTLVSEVRERSDSPRLLQVLARRSVWGPAVRDAAAAHLKLIGRPGEEAVTWSRVVEAAAASTDGVLADLATPIEGRPAVYRAETFVPRHLLDEQLAPFRESAAKALIVAGEAGSGKTSLMVHWAKRLRDDGDAVVLLGGASLGEGNPWQAVSRALGVSDEQWPDAVGTAASDAGHSLFVLIDGVNEVPGPNGPLDLFDRLNRGLDDVPLQCRVIVTLTMPVWRHIARQRGMSIRAANYFLPGNGVELALSVGEFDDSELEHAWTRYREVHSIPTPLSDISRALRSQLRNPSMMVLIAETFAGQAIPVDEVEAAIDVFRAYYERKTFQGATVDREFLRLLSLAIYDKRLVPIPYALLHDVESLREYLSVEAGSPYSRMLERAVLRQVDLPRYQPPDSIEYANSRFGAFVLAGALVIKNGTLVAAVCEAAKHLSDFPPLAETIRLLLRWDTTDALSADDFVALGGHDHPDIREMVAEALAELSGSRPAMVHDVVHRLVTSPRDGGRERQRAGLRAAYLATSADSKLELYDVFVDIAKRADDALRREALDTLYLTSRHDEDFVYEVMNRIADQVEVIKPRQARSLVDFLANLSITLYTSRPGWARGKPTSDLWYKVAVERLQLSKLSTAVLAPVRALVFAAGSRQFSQRIFEGFLVDDPKAGARLFGLSEQDKAPYRRAIALLDPAMPVSDDAKEALVALLSSDIDVFNLLAAQVVTVHSVADPVTTAPVVDDLWARAELGGRLWLLTGFATLLETVPVECLGLIEDLTRRTCTAHLDVVDSLDRGYLGAIRLDQLLLPLGLAYGVRATNMPVFTELIADGLEHRRRQQVSRCIRALGRVGFHHPRTVLAEVASLWTHIGEPSDDDSLRLELIAALATMRMLHLSDVDNFLLDVQASADFSAQVRAGIDAAPLYEQVKLLGLLTNGVHEAVCFPKMREGLLQPVYALLADSRTMRTAVNTLTHRAWTMLVEADFKLEHWAEPPAECGPCR